MFILEALASGVPVVAYNIGLMWKYWVNECKYAVGLGSDYCIKNNGIGAILNRNKRSPELTLQATKQILEFIKNGENYNPRHWVETYSLDNFRKNWQNYLKQEFNYELDS
jgi:glycosyltransferase involved in cell wall biosynthesis